MASWRSGPPPTPGVYLINRHGNNSVYSRWDGKKWMTGSGSEEGAKNASWASNCQIRKWNTSKNPLQRQPEDATPMRLLIKFFRTWPMTAAERVRLAWREWLVYRAMQDVRRKAAKIQYKRIRPYYNPKEFRR